MRAFCAVVVSALLALGMFAAPASAGPATRLIPSEPTALNQSDYVGIYPYHPNPNTAARAWTATYFTDGQPQQLDSNGQFYAQCGQQWQVRQTAKPDQPLLFASNVTVSTDGRQQGIHVKVNAARTVVTWYGRSQDEGTCP